MKAMRKAAPATAPMTAPAIPPALRRCAGAGEEESVAPVERGSASVFEEVRSAERKVCCRIGRQCDTA